MQTVNGPGTNIWGEEYIRTTDGHGNLLQISKRKEYAAGGVVYETTDAVGNYLGYSVPKADAFGKRYIETFDRSGSLISTSYEHFDYMGNPYWTIQSNEGDVIGYHKDGVTDYKDDAADRPGSAGRPGAEASSSHSSLPGGNLGLVFSLVLFFLIMVLFGALHDPSGRETVHRFVIPCVGIAPIALILIRSLRVRDIRAPFRNSMLVMSCSLMLVMLAYYIFYTARSMAWLLDSIAYYILWVFPYLFLYLYCWLSAKQALAARKTLPRDDVRRVLEAVYEPTCSLFCLCPALMILRWEFFSNDGRYGRTVIEIITILVVVCAGLGLGAIGDKIFEKVTKKAFM